MTGNTHSNVIKYVHGRRSRKAWALFMIDWHQLRNTLIYSNRTVKYPNRTVKI